MHMLWPMRDALGRPGPHSGQPAQPARHSHAPSAQLSVLPATHPPASCSLCAPPAGKGDELPGQPAQDIVFVVRQKPHPAFVRQGDDLVTQLRIPLRYALASPLPRQR